VYNQQRELDSAISSSQTTNIINFSKEELNSREERRREPLTARIHPGNRFLKLIPKSPFGKADIIKSLKESVPSNEKKDTNIIIQFSDKLDDLSNEYSNDEISLSVSLCWLYTLDSWVYKQMNIYLRDDSSLMETMAPIIYGLMQSYRNFDNSYYYSGTVYRRSLAVRIIRGNLSDGIL